VHLPKELAEDLLFWKQECPDSSPEAFFFSGREGRFMGPGCRRIVLDRRWASIGLINTAPSSAINSSGRCYGVKKTLSKPTFWLVGSVSNWPAMAKELVNHGESAHSTCHQQV
jgi:hypothetical protein